MTQNWFLLEVTLYFCISLNGLVATVYEKYVFSPFSGALKKSVHLQESLRKKEQKGKGRKIKRK